jgi:hypothetical protein
MKTVSRLRVAFPAVCSLAWLVAADGCTFDRSDLRWSTGDSGVDGAADQAGDSPTGAGGSDGAPRSTDAVTEARGGPTDTGEDTGIRADAAETATDGTAEAGPDKGGLACGTGETCGIPVTVQPPQNENPCVAYYQGSACGKPGYPACGWDTQANECWPTAWCEPSVASVGSNGHDTFYNPIMLRPASAVCGSGTSTVTYPPGTLMVWGDMYTGSPQAGGISANENGYKCVVNNIAVIINC